MELEAAIKLVLDRRGLLFTGAGFSYGAKNLHNKLIPAGGELADELLSVANIRGQADLGRASTAFLRKEQNKGSHLNYQAFHLNT